MKLSESVRREVSESRPLSLEDEASRWWPPVSVAVAVAENGIVPQATNAAFDEDDVDADEDVDEDGAAATVLADVGSAGKLSP